MGFINHSKSCQTFLTAFFNSIKINLRKYIGKVAQPFEMPLYLIVQPFGCFLPYNQRYGVEKD